MYLIHKAYAITLRLNLYIEEETYVPELKYYFLKIFMLMICEIH